MPSPKTVQSQAPGLQAVRKRQRCASAVDLPSDWASSDRARRSNAEVR